jgi:hypothetical protein
LSTNNPSKIVKENKSQDSSWRKEICKVEKTHEYITCC